MTDKQIRIIYISSPPFSGSTLVAFLLGAHPEIATVGEMVGLFESSGVATYRCSCGALIQGCSFWKKMEYEMNARGFEFNLADFGLNYVLGGNRVTKVLRTRTSHTRLLDLIRDTLIPFWPGHLCDLKSIQDRNRAFIQSVLKITDKSIFMDGTKDPIRMKYLTETPGFDVKVIQLIRDVRGVVNSYHKNLNWPLKKGAREWKRIHCDIERMIRVYSVHSSMRLKYEDLCTDPATTLKDLYRFCNVNTDVDYIDFDLSDQHIIGNRMRLKEDLQIRFDEKWKKELTPTQIRAIESVAGMMNRKYGY